VTDHIADELSAAGGPGEAGRIQATAFPGLLAPGVGTRLETAAPGARHRRGWLVRRLLLVADLVGIVGAFTFTELVFAHHHEPVGGLQPLAEWLIFVAALPLWVVAIKVYGLYDHDSERTDHSTSDEFSSVFHLVTVVTFAFFGFSWLFGLVRPDQQKLAAFWVLAIAGICGMRVLARAVARRRAAFVQNTLILGAGDVGQVIGRKLLNHPEYGLNLVGFVDSAPKERRLDLDDLTIVGTPEDLAAVVQELDVERVIVAFSNDAHEDVLNLLRSLRDLDVQIDIVPRLFEIVTPSLRMHALEGLAVIGIPPFELSRSSRLLKRVMDVVGAVIGLIVLAPVFVLIAIATKLDSRGPVFFRQMRMGTGSEPFQILKFRTMVVDAEKRKEAVASLNKHVLNGDARMFKIPDDPRVTRLGAFLRRYSIDELPQLVNVLRGEMSLVGPRPLILDENDHVTEWAKRRLNLRPGITGLWQVAGRNEIPFDEMVKLDYMYVTGWSVGGDLKILTRTIPAVLRTKHVY